MSKSNDLSYVKIYQAVWALKHAEQVDCELHVLTWKLYLFLEYKDAAQSLSIISSKVYFMLSKMKCGVSSYYSVRINDDTYLFSPVMMVLYKIKT